VGYHSAHQREGYFSPVWRTTFMKPTITLTGVDERTDITKLSHLDAEIGFLYTTTPENRSRYPRWDWIRESSLNLRKAALHVCGTGARVQLMQGKLAVSGFQRIQVNGQLTRMEVAHLAVMYPRHTIITQHNVYNTCLLSVRFRNHVILVDSSGGRGKSPETWERPTTIKTVGFAGGLGPDNLPDELEKIRGVAIGNWWVDMEGKLRRDDWFSVELAQECYEQFNRFLDT